MFKNENTKEEKTTVLGITFNSEEERREYFRKELRKKLPELKQMEGFPIGEDEDILKLSDPPYYTACPNPWLNDFIEEWEEEKKDLEEQGKRTPDFEVTEPYAADVSEGKNNPIYMAHSYHTKVPHPAIMRYIMHYTQPGDIIYDGFAGTGMTGVAASMCDNIKEVYKIASNKKTGKRNAICLDLSPIASFISSNYNNEKSYEKLKRIRAEFKVIVKDLSWLYKTNHINTNQFGLINYTVWSEVYICNSCNKEFSFWDSAVDLESKKMRSVFNCPFCMAKYTKSQVEPLAETVYFPEYQKTIKRLKLVPALINYTYNGERYEKKPDEYDLKLIDKINLKHLDYFEHDNIYEGDEIGRLYKHGIHNIRELYFRRSRYILQTLQKKLGEDFSFLLTSVTQNSSALYRYRPNGKGGTTSGTYYICATPQENNVFNSISRKIRDIEKAFQMVLYNQITSTGSATRVDLKECSIDYIFTDPPFGSNLMYSELNLLIETWLNVLTNKKKEAITSSSQNKNLLDYQRLMSDCLKENYRILKPGKWMTIEFSNTSAVIWNSIQTAISNAGFVISNVSALDKKQGSFKAVNTPTAVKQDLVISCYKPSSQFINTFIENKSTSVGIWDFVNEHLNHLPIHLIEGTSTIAIIERSPKILFDRLIAFYVQRSLPVPIDAGKFQQGLRERFVERDGMFFSNEQVQEYDTKKKKNPEFTQMSIFVSSEQDGIMWLKKTLFEKQFSYQDIHPLWLQALANVRKGDIIPELATLLEENFLNDDADRWYIPDPENESDLEKLRLRRLLKTFEGYKAEAEKPRTKIKEVRVEALREGFKQCWQDKDFKTIVSVGNRIPNNLLMEDEVLLQFYDIASSRV